MPSVKHYYPAGAVGEEGREASTAPAVGEHGTTWSDEVRKTIRKLDLNHAAAFANPTSLVMLVHAAEADFLNGDTLRAAKRLLWVTRATAETIPTEQLAAPFTPTDRRTPAQEVVNALRARSQTMLNRLAAGSDFFGRRRDWAPLSDHEYLNNAFEAISPIAKMIEDEARKFWQDRLNTTEARAALDEAVKLYSNAATLLETSIREEEARSNGLQDEISTLGDRLRQLEAQIRTAEAKFKQAVIDQAQGCSFGQMVSFATSVVAVAAGSYTAIVGVVSSIQDYNRASEVKAQAAKDGNATVPGKDVLAAAYKNTDESKRLEKWKNDKNFLSTLTTVGKNLADLGKAARQADELLKQKDDNRHKIAIQKDNYEEVLKPFLNLPEARRLKQLLDTFLATAQARNERVLDYSHSQLRADDLRSQIAVKQHRANEMRGYLASHQNPELDSVADFLNESLQEIKLQLIWWLEMARGSLSFWALDDVRLSYNDKTIAALLVSYADLRNQELRAIEAAGRPEAAYGGTDGVLVRITADSHRGLFEEFKKTGTIVLNFAPGAEPFRAFSSLRIRRFKAFLQGVSGKDPSASTIVTVDLEHLGTSIFETNKGVLREYHHKPRRASFAYYLNDRAEVADGTFNGLSPTNERLRSVYSDVSQLGLFSMKINRRTMENLDLSGMESIELRFWGTYLPFD